MYMSCVFPTKLTCITKIRIHERKHTHQDANSLVLHRSSLLYHVHAMHRGLRRYRRRIRWGIHIQMNTYTYVMCIVGYGDIAAESDGVYIYK